MYYVVVILQQLDTMMEKTDFTIKFEISVGLVMGASRPGARPFFKGSGSTFSEGLGLNILRRAQARARLFEKGPEI